MLYSQNRSEQRAFLSNAWVKFQNNEGLDPMEFQLVEIIKLHPEYHHLILDFVEYFPEHDWIANPVQLSRYLPGEYYHWHQDVISGRSSQRAYTLTITLQPAEGAHIEIEDTVYDLNAGEGIVFPSDLQHRATPPTSGTRYALTVWAMRRVTG